MDADAGFLRAIVENPGDGGPRLVYADWLEERGDPRGEFLQLRAELERFPSRARGKRVQLIRDRVRELWRQIPNIRDWLHLMDNGWQIPGPLVELILATEAGCVIDCCGIDALEITDANIRRWISTGGAGNARKALEQIDSLLEKINASSVPLGGSRLNHNFTVEQSVAWLGEWREGLRRVLHESGAGSK
jgi:uncharacterized protein (TIGR02996 family)